MPGMIETASEEAASSFTVPGTYRTEGNMRELQRTASHHVRLSVSLRVSYGCRHVSGLAIKS
jgi:hypothetical protein